MEKHLNPFTPIETDSLEEHSSGGVINGLVGGGRVSASRGRRGLCHGAVVCEEQDLDGEGETGV